MAAVRMRTHTINQYGPVRFGPVRFVQMVCECASGRTDTAFTPYDLIHNTQAWNNNIDNLILYLQYVHYIQ